MITLHANSGGNSKKVWPNISDARHEMYACTAVVAHWRLMPTAERHELAREKRGLRLEALDERLLGGTVFERPLDQAGFPESNRFLGIRDWS